MCEIQILIVLKNYEIIEDDFVDVHIQVVEKENFVDEVKIKEEN